MRRLDVQDQSMQQCMSLFCVDGLNPTLIHRNLKNPVFLDNVCQFSIRLKNLTHIIRVNRFRRGRGGKGGRLEDINSRHNLYVKTDGLCTVTPIYNADVD